MSSIGEGCDSLGKTSLLSLVGNHWATGGLRVNLSSVKGRLISLPLFLLDENAILPMTANAGCDMICIGLKFDICIAAFISRLH